MGDRVSGVLLHLTSLPGPHGSGDLGPGARHFVDWLVSAGQRWWQILPLGGIGSGNSPYMSSSAFAGNVLLIDLSDLAHRGWLEADELGPDRGFCDARVEFAAVVPWRMRCLAAAARRFAEQGSATERAAFEAFCAEQAEWLDDYALFMSLADAFDQRAWSEWPAALARRQPSALAAARLEHRARIDFWRFCQWCFFAQWHGLRAYANERGVMIVGDAPIFVSWQSADVWAHQRLFELDADGRPSVVAGVPPDYFSVTGQRWGNPLYRWAEHERDGYAWWVARLRRTFELVDVVRIDHFRGFAACWQIDADEPTAVNGRWVPGPGAALFDAVARALGELPIIAEDLGLITPDVTRLRKQFRFPGMRVLQFAFGGDSANLYLPHNHEADSVVYCGTHDNDTTAGWWRSADEPLRRHVCDYLGIDGGQICRDMIRAACASVADAAIHPMQDVLGLGSDSRMNTPGQASGCWEWRFTWSQVRPEHAQWLAHLCRLYRRDGTLLQG